MNIYLIGYSYSGKTTLGRQLAKELGYSFYDTDKAIEIKFKTTIPLFFSRYGEKAFRIVERQMLQETGKMDNVVVSTGGGTPCNEENLRFILSYGIAIYLKMSVEEIMQRMMASHRIRPLLAEKSTEEKLQFIAKHLAEREKYYAAAHFTIPAANATEKDIKTLLTNAE